MMLRHILETCHCAADWHRHLCTKAEAKLQTTPWAPNGNLMELGCKGSCPQTVRFSGLLAGTLLYKCLVFNQAAYQASGSISWRSNPSWPQALKVKGGILVER